MSSPQKLDDAIYSKIQDLCAQGDELAKASDFPSALEKYWAAWDLVPEPKTEWEAATWILAAVGDANFLGGDFAAGRDNLSNATSQAIDSAHAGDWLSNAGHATRPSKGS